MARSSVLRFERCTDRRNGWSKSPTCCGRLLCLVMDAVKDREVCLYVCVCVRGGQFLNPKVEGVGLQIDEGTKTDQKKSRGGGVCMCERQGDI